MNGAGWRLIEMDLARLFRKFRPDIIGIGGELGAELSQHGVGLGTVHPRRRSGLRAPLCHIGRHGGFAYLRAAAAWTGNRVCYCLLIVGRGRVEPGFEAMSLLAS